MARLQEDTRFIRRNARRFWLYVAIAVILPQCWPWGSVWLRIVLAMGGTLVGYGLAAVMENVAVRTYRCPRCGQHIGSSPYDYENWDRIVIKCADCQIDWDLQITPPKSDRDDHWN